MAPLCPHCKTPASVETVDLAAGKSVACGTCGRSIKVTASDREFAAATGEPNPFAPPSLLAPYSSPGMVGRLTRTQVSSIVVTCLGLLFCGGILAALLVPSIQSNIECRKRSNSGNKLRQIGIAIYAYHDEYNELPPAFVKDSSGKPLYSGFVLLLPFLDQENLYRQFSLDEAWDSPHNVMLSQQVVLSFQCSASVSKVPGRGDYLLLGGPGSALDPALEKRTWANITDGKSNTIMAIETKIPSRSWAEPRFWNSSQSFDGPCSSVVQFLVCDGSVQNYSKQPPPGAKTLRAIETASGGEVIDAPY